jgi:hypothetical protein
MRSLHCLNVRDPVSHNIALGFTQPLAEISTWYVTPPPSETCGSLDFSLTYEPLRPVTGRVSIDFFNTFILCSFYVLSMKTTASVV